MNRPSDSSTLLSKKKIIPTTGFLNSNFHCYINIISCSKFRPITLEEVKCEKALKRLRAQWKSAAHPLFNLTIWQQPTLAARPLSRLCNQWKSPSTRPILHCNFPPLSHSKKSKRNSKTKKNNGKKGHDIEAKVESHRQRWTIAYYFFQEKKKDRKREREIQHTQKKNGHKKNGDNCLDFSPTSSVFLEAIIRRKNGVVIFPRKATLPCPLQPLPAVLTENKSMGMQMRCEQFFLSFSSKFMPVLLGVARIAKDVTPNPGRIPRECGTPL